MDNSPKSNPKDDLREAADYFEAGNYREASIKLKELSISDLPPNLKDEAQTLKDKLKFDRVELIYGLASLTLLLSLFIYFGFLR